MIRYASFQHLIWVLILMFIANQGMAQSSPDFTFYHTAECYEIEELCQREYNGIGAAYGNSGQLKMQIHCALGKIQTWRTYDPSGEWYEELEFPYGSCATDYYKFTEWWSNGNLKTQEFLGAKSVYITYYQNGQIQRRLEQENYDDDPWEGVECTSLDVEYYRTGEVKSRLECPKCEFEECPPKTCYNRYGERIRCTD